MGDYTIHEIYTKKSFLKIKQAFEINKIQFAFVEMDERTKKQKKSIDFYMTVSDAALLAKKILDGRMYRVIETKKNEAQKSGKLYADDAWKSPLGGVSEESAKRRGLRNDGRAVSRSFSIVPGSSQYAVLTARQQAGQSNAQGLIVPVKDDNPTIIRVAVANYDELEKLALMVDAAISSYMHYAMSKDIQAYVEARKNKAG